MKLNTTLTTWGLLATLTVGGIAPALADGYQDRSNNQTNKNNMRNLAIGGAAVAAYGLFNHNNAATLLGAAGAVLAGSQYEKDRKQQSQNDNRYYYRDGRNRNSGDNQYNNWNQNNQRYRNNGDRDYDNRRNDNQQYRDSRHDRNGDQNTWNQDNNWSQNNRNQDNRDRSHDSNRDHNENR